MQIFSKFLLLSIFIFGVLSFNALANKQSADFEVINLADDFYTLYQSSKTLTAENRAEQFSQHFTSQFAPFYSDKSFVKAIEGFSGIEEVYFSKNRRLSKELNSSMESFIATFPDFKSEIPIYILHSLGRFNGATRELNGKTYLMFGVDLMAKYHTWKNDTPFFHHELFHVYHEKLFQCKDELWCSIWTEGLATYVSHKLTPSASDDELMLNIPSNLVKKIRARHLDSFVDLKKKFYSKKTEIYSSFFNFAKDETKLPYRRGYYLGYILAKEIGKNYSLEQLAKMDKKTVESLLLKELDLLIKAED
ncbi:MULTISPECIES: DUF5700 domain-containing putative Zn-dependent protease [unclassified Pseudoalteromonas]|uniref:DUF5700 domain-containing putative Zn-dependent protease n=1 Tax=unclassified Pseudoalteromonas TaxID=194690 RepID=UPI00110C0920|nr:MULTISPECIES: DUF5700 domain-containing putative Zn-dependent protease [unclassified Pseudoalteromonas]TMP41592.1 hypothetical protein CWB80_20460 [Pseudoalteromonas sp. S1650]TMP65540.1 hypothetical protein CWB79_15775 [Pseudoalteromonas sp. S1649]